jgi:hypothetical protein
MEDIAREAGVANGTVYLYFPTKDALLTAAVPPVHRTAHDGARVARLRSPLRPAGRSTPRTCGC